MTSGLFLSQTTLNTLPPSLRDELLSAVFGPAAPVPGPDAAREESDPLGPTELDDEHFAELSSGQAKEFLRGCGSRTRAVVELIANSETRYFQLKDIANALNVKPKELPGVWAGLTKRTRTVTKDASAYLIHWSGEGIYDEDDNYSDHSGEVREVTRRSFRKALGLA